MRKIEPEFITGMGYIGASPGVLYRMGGPGEQTVVTGNPALLEGVKGNRFTSLTLHGKSTQGSTTGVQLLPFEVGEKREGFEVFKDGIAISGARKKDIYAVGRDGMTNESSYDDFPLLASGEYYVYSDSASVNLIVVAFRNGGNITLGSSMKGVAAKIKVMDGDKFRIFLRIEEAFNGKVKAMISKTQPTTANYEPYTGGAPSPSPSYPQEIESTGQSGEIGVDVYGGNLFDIRKASPWEDAYGLQMSLDGEYITVKGVTTTTSYGNISFRILGYPVNLYGNRFSMDIVKNVGTSKEYVYTSATENTLALSVVVDAKAAVELKFRLMVNAGSTALPYEPYKPAQKLIIPTSGGLPGIPVSSGGNYTDEKSQQWVADEIDLAKGERVQRIEEYRFTGAEAWNSWGVNKYTEGITGFYWYFKNTLSTVQKRILNTHAVFSDNAWDGREEGTVAVVDLNDKYITWSVRNEYLEDISDNNVAIESFKKMLGEINAKMLYCLAEPIRTPLPPETIAAYKALKTYSPTTTVINDADAWMSVGYKRRK